MSSFDKYLGPNDVWRVIRVSLGVAYVVIIVLAILYFLTGCMKTTRVVMDKDGKRTEEVTSWEPIVVNTYPAPPVVYTEPVVYPVYYPPVVYRTYHPAPIYYPAPVVYQRSYVVPRPVYYGRTVYVGRGVNHYRHR